MSTEEEGQQRVVEASLTLVRELARLKADHVRQRGGAIATSCMLGVPLGHNSSFLQVTPIRNILKSSVALASFSALHTLFL